MPLPNLNNDSPTYEMVIPSTNKPVKFRPFLVKEQRNLMVALESRDTKQILDATLKNIESCVPQVDIMKLATFDVDYMFTQIRSKSVGETASVNVKCSKCEAKNSIDIPLSKITLEGSDLSSLIELTPTVKIEMKYPSYQDMMKGDKVLNDKSNYSERMFEMIMICAKGVYYEDQYSSFAEETREEIERFFNNLTAPQLDMITEFVDGLPTLRHEQDFKCVKCGHENKLVLEGLTDFFS